MRERESKKSISYFHVLLTKLNTALTDSHAVPSLQSQLNRLPVKTNRLTSSLIDTPLLKTGGLRMLLKTAKVKTDGLFKIAAQHIYSEDCYTKMA